MSKNTLTFDDIFDRLIGHEGGYVNDPADPGGETQWGISKRSYPHLNIKTLTREEAKEIYRKDFWQKINADKLYDGVAWQLMDFAINSGIQTAIRYFQRALGVADDGYWGPESQKTADAMSESDQIMRLLGERLDFMTRLKNWPNHGKGWARRIAANLRYGSEDN
ncbi:MAG: glycoside hydrolase family 108 protein [Candidatus Altimarinota bacterium]